MNKLQKLQYANALRDFHKHLRSMMRERGLGRHRPSDDDEFTEAMESMVSDVQQVAFNYLVRVKTKRSTYCALFSMPPARRAKSVKTGKPVTLVESRAIAAKKKVETWQRKAKLANTKIKIYRRKVTYYKKKGVI